MAETTYVATKVRIPEGPAMSALSERWRTFVLALFHNGGNASEAARIAGFSDIGGGCRVRGYELLRDPRVQAALKELGDADFARLGVKARARIEAMLDMPNHKDHFAASKFALGQAGFREARDVNVTVVKSDDEMKAEIVRMAREMGKDPREFLGANAIDVQFEDVTAMNVDGEEY